MRAKMIDKDVPTRKFGEYWPTRRFSIYFARIVTKRKKDLSRFLYDTKDHLA